MKTQKKQYRILMVDDERQYTDLMAEILKNDYTYVTAADGESALRIIFSDDPPDLVLLDIGLPEISGYEVCSRMRKNTATREIPVLFLTGLRGISDLIEGFKSGGQDYIRKPFSPLEILARIKTHIELKEKKEQLTSLSQMLEKKVEDRTYQLQVANKQLETLNRQLATTNAQLICLDMEKTRFLSLISHAIRTPLNGIAGFTKLLENELQFGRHQEHINLLKESVENLVKLSNKALMITEIQARGTKIEKKMIDISVLIEKILTDLQDKIRTNNLMVNKEIPGQLLLPGNEELLNHCFGLILDNAIKYSYKNGKIQIKAESGFDSVTVEIIDRGRGFSESEINQMFGNLAAGQNYSDFNLGLGLVAAKLIMEAHSGKIGIYNNQTKGATVRLVFPNLIS